MLHCTTQDDLSVGGFLTWNHSWDHIGDGAFTHGTSLCIALASKLLCLGPQCVFDLDDHDLTAGWKHLVVKDAIESATPKTRAIDDHIGL